MSDNTQDLTSTTSSFTDLLGWDDYKFEEWIPEKIRHQLKNFWCSEDPHTWIQNTKEHPPIGARVEAFSTENGVPKLIGRWVPMWNNIGRVITDDGKIECAHTCNIIVLPNTTGG